MTRTKWPATSAERTDRHVVQDAVRLVGHAALRFTIADVRKAIAEHPNWQLAHPGQLSRHIAALTPVTLESVGQPLAAVEREGHTAAKSHHLYVLRERIAEHLATPPTLTEPERIYVALWVATRALGTEAVETSVVTRVCQAVPALAVRTDRQMAMRLKQLAHRGSALVAMLSPAHRADGTPGRWVRWQPIGREPEHPQFDSWVALAQAMLAHAGLNGAGYATAHDVMIDLLALTIARSKSAAWPDGHSVTVEEIDAACIDDAEAARLRDLLRQRGTSIGRVLGDASKARIAGRGRVARRVVKVGTVPGGRAYYDAPALPGYHRRALIVPYMAVRGQLERHHAEAMVDECHQARRLAETRTTTEAAGLVCRAIAAVRVLAVHRQLDGLEEQAMRLLEQRPDLSERSASVIRRHLDQLTRVRTRLAESPEKAEDMARAANEQLDVSLDAILGAERPLLTGDEYLAWVPPAQRKHHTGAELLSYATALARFPNPRHTRRMDPDPARAAETGVDRVDALIHLAERAASRVLTFVQGGRELLGSTLRDPTLPRLLLTAGDDRLAGRALAALTLLGDEATERTAMAVLEVADTPADRVVQAMEALALLGRAGGVADWPQHLWERDDPRIASALRAVITAAHQGRRLL